MKLSNIAKISLLASIFTIAHPIAAKEADVDPMDMSLEELMNTQIYSASKRPEKISDVAASVYVITSEDIKKAGVTSIPEALRMAPGVNVAQTTANTWAISIRGFNRQFSNKLLVMIDGRTVYTPLFSGVWWDSQDYVLEDIERIEVIKGSGGTLWGANAVNGVINIITKEARKTQGSYASFTAGNTTNGIGEFRHGGKIGEVDFYRAYGKYTNSKDFESTTTGADNHDTFNRGQTGFRYDFRDKDMNAATLQGDFYSGRKRYNLNQAPITPFSVDHADYQGANVMFKYNLPSGEYDTNIQAYVDYVTQDLSPILKYETTTYDIDVQTSRDIGRHSLMAGGEIRYIMDSIDSSQYLNYGIQSTSVAILSTFLQDKITLTDKLFLTLGSKFDYNDYTNFEFQPNARLLYQINDSNSVWAAVSRAVRTPSRGEDSFVQQGITGTPLGTAFVRGNSSYGSEKLHSYELGYRSDISNNLFVDISTFYNTYYDLRTFEATAGAPPIPLQARNNGTGETYGVESYALWGATEKVDLKFGHTFLLQNFHENTTDLSLQRDEERSPEHQFNIGSYVKVDDNMNWDTNAYYTSNLHYFTAAGTRTKIDSYLRFDSQLRWQATKQLELSLIGQNLLDDAHQEYDEIIFSTPSFVPRAVLARASYKF